MSTRSLIGLQREDGKLETVYCHWDGQVVGGVGETLYNYYNTRQDVRDLISGGDLSSLGITTGLSEYYADRGEPLSPAAIDNPAKLRKDLVGSGIEYVYIMMGGGSWIVTDINNGLIVYDLADALKETA